MLLSPAFLFIAFSSEVELGSREENASKPRLSLTEASAPDGLIATGEPRRAMRYWLAYMRSAAQKKTRQRGRAKVQGETLR
jgi:hypothetical protein